MGLQLILVQALIRLGLIKDFNLTITVRRPLKWLVKGLKERWSWQELNPGPLAYCAMQSSATELQLPPATTPLLCPYVACSSKLLIEDLRSFLLDLI